jgi:hypothetical protein
MTRPEFDNAMCVRGYKSIREDDPDGGSSEMWVKQCICGFFAYKFVDPAIYDPVQLDLELEAIDNVDCGHKI